MRCGVCDELAIRYLLAIDQTVEANRQSDQAVTALQRECARSFLNRAEEHESYTFRELWSHRRSCVCLAPEVEEILMGHADHAAEWRSA